MISLAVQIRHKLVYMVEDCTSFESEAAKPLLVGGAGKFRTALSKESSPPLVKRSTVSSSLPLLNVTLEVAKASLC